jgi:hypothetical protein
MHETGGDHDCHEMHRGAEKSEACSLQPVAAVLLGQHKNGGHRAHINMAAKLFLANQLQPLKVVPIGCNK